MVCCKLPVLAVPPSQNRPLGWLQPCRSPGGLPGGTADTTMVPSFHRRRDALHPSEGGVRSAEHRERHGDARAPKGVACVLAHLCGGATDAATGGVGGARPSWTYPTPCRGGCCVRSTAGPRGSRDLCRLASVWICSRGRFLPGGNAAGWPMPDPGPTPGAAGDFARALPAAAATMDICPGAG
eukprot:gene12943-biopygen23010